MKRLAVLIGLMAASIAMIYALASSAPATVITSHTTKQEAADEPYIAIGKNRVFVEIVKDEAAIRRGLSGRIHLGAERGMLFIFPAADRYRFWMPDMHFPIDIIWIAEGKPPHHIARCAPRSNSIARDWCGGEIAGITQNVSPEFDPTAPRLYAPPRPVRYVLEVNAGFAEAHRIGVEDKVAFHNIHQ